MNFDLENPVIKLCAEGMQLEGEGKAAEAAAIFMHAWEQATNDFERFTAAHYVARHQKTKEDKLKWDKTALRLALAINDDSVKGALPSLYLNIAKCYEDLGDVALAKENYEAALEVADFLQDDGYGNMIRNGINKGLERMK